MDDTKALPSPAPVRKRRRAWKVLAGLALLAIATVASVPRLLGTKPARAWLVGRINAKLAPGSADLEGVQLTWTGPIELSGVALRDPKGKPVLAARRVRLDRGLVGLLADRSNLGRIAIEGATVDVERRIDGSIDVLEALASVLKPGPAPTTPAPVVAAGPAPAASKMVASVVIEGGTLRIVSPELVEPIVSEGLEGSVTIAPGRPIELAATLTNSGSSMDLRASLDPGGDRVLSVVAKGWPVHVRQAGVEARGRLEGTVGGKSEGGHWAFQGDASLLGLDATGPALSGDRLAIDRVVATCDAGQSASGWTIRKFSVTSPVASLHAAGSVPAVDGRPSELRGRVDLAALAKMLPHAMSLRAGLSLDQGAIGVRIALTNPGGADRAELVASLDDFIATEGGRRLSLREPARLNGLASRARDKVTVEKLEVKAAGVDVSAGGDLEAGVKLSGTIDLVALMAQLRDVLDLGAFDLSGHARVAADYRRLGDSYKGRFAADCKDLKVVGLTAEPIVRDPVRIDATAVGPCKVDGMPTGWLEAKLDVKAADLRFDVLAISKAGAVSLVSTAGMDVASPVPGRAVARASFRRDGKVFEVEELRASLNPTDPKHSKELVALAVKGRLDLASGEGIFSPLPGSPVGPIGLASDGGKVSGLGRSDVPLLVEASLLGDLGSLDRLMATWSGSALKGLGGAWTGRVAMARGVDGKLDVNGIVNAADITAPGLKGPVGVVMKADYLPALDKFDLWKLDLETVYARVGLVGTLVEATKGRRLMDLAGTVEPNWATVDRLVAKSVEENARVRATVRPIHLRGPLLADSTPQLLDQLSGEVALDVAMAEAFGVKLTPMPVILKMGNGKATFDPIITTMNDGPVMIRADLALDDAYGLRLRLGLSRIDGAAINEAVSNSILAYVAPVLARSSSVSGKVTVAIKEGSVPITAAGPLALDGVLVFQNVICDPGPLGSELTSITGRGAPKLRLDQSIAVQVANGRVKQSGLSIPLNGNAKVAIEGSVGFDESLDLKATVPLSARALGLDASFDKLAGGTTVAIPIRGTLAKPSVDRQAFKGALRAVAKGLTEQGLKGEAGRLLERIAGPNQADGDPKSRPARKDPLGDLENIGRGLLDPKKP